MAVSTGNGTNKLISWNNSEIQIILSLMRLVWVTTEVFVFHCIAKSSRRSSEHLSVAGFTVGNSIWSHHTVALCDRQVLVVVTFLHLPELWPLGSFLFCPCITSLEFLSCSPCAVPPFELHSGGAVVPTIASLMSWFSNPKFRRINLTRHFMAIFDNFCLFSLLL